MNDIQDTVQKSTSDLQVLAALAGTQGLVGNQDGTNEMVESGTREWYIRDPRRITGTTPIPTYTRCNGIGAKVRFEEPKMPGLSVQPGSSTPEYKEDRKQIACITDLDISLKGPYSRNPFTFGTKWYYSWQNHRKCFAGPQFIRGISDAWHWNQNNTRYSDIACGPGSFSGNPTTTYTCALHTGSGTVECVSVTWSDRDWQDRNGYIPAKVCFTGRGNPNATISLPFRRPEIVLARHTHWDNIRRHGLQQFESYCRDTFTGLGVPQNHQCQAWEYHYSSENQEDLHKQSTIRGDILLQERGTSQSNDAPSQDHILRTAPVGANIDVNAAILEYMCDSPTRVRSHIGDEFESTVHANKTELLAKPTTGEPFLGECV